MKIKFSRHSRRRIKLYRIAPETITKILERKELTPGKHEIIENVEGFIYPLKIVVTFENGIITIITSYVMKKGRKE